MLAGSLERLFHVKYQRQEAGGPVSSNIVPKTPADLTGGMAQIEEIGVSRRKRPVIVSIAFIYLPRS